MPVLYGHAAANPWSRQGLGPAGQVCQRGVWQLCLPASSSLEGGPHAGVGGITPMMDTGHTESLPRYRWTL